MKQIGIALTFLGIFALFMTIGYAIKANYQYEKQIKSHWELSDKASTISQKSAEVDIFVAQLEQSNLQGTYDAIVFPTPDNSFDNNFIALKSLQSRLHQIDTMDANSFQYNTAIQQITEQEQGGACAMLNIFKGCWYKEHYILLWDWIAKLQVILTITIIVAGIGICASET
jgi:predicted negative regulator of RcsB-dependent stress response